MRDPVVPTFVSTQKVSAQTRKLCICMAAYAKTCRILYTTPSVPLTFQCSDPIGRVLKPRPLLVASARIIRPSFQPSCRSTASAKACASTWESDWKTSCGMEPCMVVANVRRRGRRSPGARPCPLRHHSLGPSIVTPNWGASWRSRGWRPQLPLTSSSWCWRACQIQAWTSAVINFGKIC
jgi:hypothetical protein